MQDLHATNGEKARWGRGSKEGMKDDRLERTVEGGVVVGDGGGVWRRIHARRGCECKGERREVKR